MKKPVSKVMGAVACNDLTSLIEDKKLRPITEMLFAAAAENAMTASDIVDNSFKLIRQLQVKVLELSRTTDPVEIPSHLHSLVSAMHDGICSPTEGQTTIQDLKINAVANNDDLGAFLIAELSPSEDCHDAQTAAKRLYNIAEQMRDLEEHVSADIVENSPGV